jgi:peptidyl-prolyl cis-trans isomerase C
MQARKAVPLVALIVSGMLSLTACSAAEDDNVAMVNGVPIPAARMDYVLKAQVQQGQQDTPELRKQVREVLITRELLAQEAIKQGLDKDPAVVTGLDMARQEFLIRAYFDDFVKKNQPTEDEIKAEYERVKARQTAGGAKQEYKARHILIKDEKKAKSVLQQVNKAHGKNFAQLAKKYSEDAGSKEQGGDLDWSDGSNFVPEFSAAMTKLKKGEYTKELVKSKYGYHIIMVDDVRTAEFPALDDKIKQSITQQLLTRKRDEAIEALRKSARVEGAAVRE